MTPGPWDKEALWTLLRFARKNNGPWDEDRADDTWLPDENDAYLIAALPETLEEVDRLRAEVDEARAVLCNLASYVGCGASVEWTSVKDMDDRIRAGLDMIPVGVSVEAFGRECRAKEAAKASAARLEAALREAREAIASAPEDAFGSVPETGVREGWWIRDELVHKLTKALENAP